MSQSFTYVSSGRLLVREAVVQLNNPVSVTSFQISELLRNIIALSYTFDKSSTVELKCSMWDDMKRRRLR